MLILTRKPGEIIVIGEDTFITVVEIKGNQVRVGIEAPREKRVFRKEIYDQIQAENKAAAGAQGSLEDLRQVMMSSGTKQDEEEEETTIVGSGLSRLTTSKLQKSPITSVKKRGRNEK